MSARKRSRVSEVRVEGGPCDGRKVWIIDRRAWIDFPVLADEAPTYILQPGRAARALHRARYCREPDGRYTFAHCREW